MNLFFPPTNTHWQNFRRALLKSAADFTGTLAALGAGKLPSPTPWSIPSPVCDTSSAAPPTGLVITPIRPRPTPVTSPVARWEAEDGEEVRVCRGWSAIPATAPDTTREIVTRNEMNGVTVYE